MVKTKPPARAFGRAFHFKALLSDWVSFHWKRESGFARLSDEESKTTRPRQFTKKEEKKNQKNKQ